MQWMTPGGAAIAVICTLGVVSLQYLIGAITICGNSMCVEASSGNGRVGWQK